MRACSLTIHGRVQGVFFRKSTREKAKQLGIQGTVKNCDDGTVEIFAEGKDDVLKQFVEWCHHGPDGARVDRIDINDEALKNLHSFIITH